MFRVLCTLTLATILTACSTSLPVIEMTLSNGRVVAVDCYAKSYVYKGTTERHAFNAKDPVSAAINRRCMSYPDYMSNTLNRTGQRTTFIFEHK